MRTYIHIYTSIYLKSCPGALLIRLHPVLCIECSADSCEHCYHRGRIEDTILPQFSLANYSQTFCFGFPHLIFLRNKFRCEVMSVIL